MRRVYPPTLPIINIIIPISLQRKNVLLQVLRKGILQKDGRVSCRNIKRQCPPTPCDEPVLRVGQCCKLCPHQGMRKYRISSYPSL